MTAPLDASPVNVAVAEPATAGGLSGTAVEGRSLRQIAWRRLRRDKVAMAGGVVVILLCLVEAIGLYGVGEFTVMAINNQDLPEIMGVTLVATFFVVIANLVVDVLYAVMDPRVRLS